MLEWQVFYCFFPLTIGQGLDFATSHWHILGKKRVAISSSDGHHPERTQAPETIDIQSPTRDQQQTDIMQRERCSDVPLPGTTY
jgi:hypothetical protein